MKKCDCFTVYGFNCRRCIICNIEDQKTLKELFFVIVYIILFAK